MSKTAIHVMHEFDPNYLLTKVKVALANRDVFVKNRLEKIAKLALSNRKEYIAYNNRSWWQKSFLEKIGLNFGVPVWDKEVLSEEDTIEAIFKDTKKVDKVLDSFRWGTGRTEHPYDVFLVGMHRKEITDLFNQINTGSTWIEHIRALENGLENSNPKESIISENVLTSLNYWEQMTED